MANLLCAACTQGCVQAKQPHRQHTSQVLVLFPAGHKAVAVRRRAGCGSCRRRRRHGRLRVGCGELCEVAVQLFAQRHLHPLVCFSASRMHGRQVRAQTSLCARWGTSRAPQPFQSRASCASPASSTTFCHCCGVAVLQVADQGPICRQRSDAESLCVLAQRVPTSRSKGSRRSRRRASCALPAEPDAGTGRQSADNQLTETDSTFHEPAVRQVACAHRRALTSRSKGSPAISASRFLRSACRSSHSRCCCSFLHAEVKFSDV